MSGVRRRSTAVLAVLAVTAVLVIAWLFRPAPRPGAPVDVSLAATDSQDSNPPLLSRDEEAGRLLFERHCAMCHGRTGDGFGINAPNLPVAVPDLASSTQIGAWDDTRLFERIARGGGTAARPPVCPAWGRRLTPRDIDALVAFLRRLSRSDRTGRSAS